MKIKKQDVSINLLHGKNLFKITPTRLPSAIIGDDKIASFTFTTGNLDMGST